MTKDQTDTYFACIKGIIDATCIKCMREKTSKKFKQEIKFRFSHFIPYSNKKFMHLMVDYAIKQYQSHKSLNNLNAEFYKTTEAYGDTLLMLLRNAEK